MKKILYSLPLLLALGACSNEEVVTQEPNEPTGEAAYYLTMNLGVPTDLSAPGTRANGDHILAGTDAEKLLSKVDIYLLDADATSGNCKKNKVLWSKTYESTKFTLTDGDDNSGKVDKSYKLEIKLEQSEVNDLTALIGHNVSVLVIGNPVAYGSYTGYTDSFEGVTFNLTNGYLDFINGTVAGREMPMSNYEEITAISTFKNIDITETDADAKKYGEEVAVRSKFTLSEESKYTFNLTPGTSTIDLERAYARLDLGDGSGNRENPFVYTLKDGKTGPNTDIKLGLYSVQPFNLNTTGYVVRHGAAGGENATTPSTSATLWGNTGTNSWVIDPSSTYITDAWSKTGKNELDVTNYPHAVRSTKTPILLTEITADINRKYGSSEYYSLGYILENTIPNTEWMVDNDGENSKDLPHYATGVQFKFQVMNAAGTAPLTSEDTTLPNGITKDGENITIFLAKTDKYMIVEPTTVGDKKYYFITYEGFINHNTNVDKSALKALDYAIVRNTVYQLKVNSITSLPNAKEAVYYLDLDINVLKWNSREVGFDF